MKKTLWQKIDHKIAKLKIFRNTCTLTKETISTDLETGETSVSSSTIELKCTAPEKVSERLIDNKLVFSGDMSITFDYISLLNTASASTPPLAFSVGTGIFNPGEDKITFGGVVYGIRSIIPQDWQNNQPGAYLVILKNACNEETETEEEQETTAPAQTENEP